MEIKKILIIDNPRKILNLNEMAEVIGGVNCVSYHDGFFTDTCMTYNGSPCTQGGDEPYCISYRW